MSKNNIANLALDRALSQIGTTEGKGNDNTYARQMRDQGAPNFAPYCAIGTGWCYKPWFNWDDVFTLPWYVPGIWNDARRKGWTTVTPSDGDLVIYEFNGDKLSDHVGLAAPSLGAGKAVEFNTGPGNGGSQSNGDGVYLRTRSRSLVRGYVSMSKVLRDIGVPATSDDRGPLPVMRRGARGNFVKDIQRVVGAEPDGVFGSGTESKVKAFQKRNGLTADGIVGAETWSAGAVKAPIRMLVRNKLRKGSRGSQVIEVQRIVKVKPDGVFGPDTEDAVRRFQKAKGLASDGVVGADTWRALLGAPVRVI